MEAQLVPPTRRVLAIWKPRFRCRTAPTTQSNLSRTRLETHEVSAIWPLTQRASANQPTATKQIASATAHLASATRAHVTLRHATSRSHNSPTPTTQRRNTTSAPRQTCLPPLTGEVCQSDCQRCTCPSNAFVDLVPSASIFPTFAPRVLNVSHSS